MGLVPDGPGMRQRPVVVCLHGGPGFDHSMLKPYLAPLADEAQLVFRDHRGNGRSDPSTTERWNLDTWVDDVPCLLRCAGDNAELLMLWHENTVLRRQISRVYYQPGDRPWLAALSRRIPRRRWSEVFAVTPATLLAWHRRLVARKWDYTGSRRRGRPATAAAIRMLAIRMAIDNPTWGL